MTMVLPLASIEQALIVDTLSTSNAIVDSVAGSGKTTAALHIALKHCDKRILLLTYNASLKIETRQKSWTLGLKNFEVHNYHAFCCKYLSKGCLNDEGISKALTNLKLKKEFDYDIIIVDEAQDMTHLYFKVVCHIICRNVKDCKLCFIGDKDQSIYAFNNADQRFITMADKIFSFNPNPWTKLKLSTSYRVTNEMAQFINQCVLSENRMIADKQGSKVRYIVCNVFDDKDSTYVPMRELERYLKRYSYDDIFIIAPSVKSNRSPARVLANKLTRINIPIFVPNTDDEKMDEEVIRGKIVFSTFHQVKGCQRKVVMVFGFDDFYTKFHAKDILPNRCPNPLYVAISRAEEELAVFHHYSNGYLPFLNQKSLKQVTEFIAHERVRVSGSQKPMVVVDTHVTDLTKFLPASVIEEAKSFIDFDVVQNKAEFIDIPRKSTQGQFVENVTEITGTAIPAYLNYSYTGSSVISKYDDDMKDPAVLLKLANIYCSNTSQYTYKLSQIKDYDWLSVENLTRCTERLQQHITKDSLFEKKIIIENPQVQYNRKLIGMIDCIHKKQEVWEFKCVSKLVSEHLIQLALYAYMVETEERIAKKHININSKEKDIMELLGKFNIEPNDNFDGLHKNYYLFNILDNKIVQLKATYTGLCEMTKFLIQKKYVSNLTMSDHDFIKACSAVYESYLLVKNEK